MNLKTKIEKKIFNEKKRKTPFYLVKSDYGNVEYVTREDGQRISKWGYLLDGCLRLIHIVVFQKSEKIRKGWEIHHCNGNKEDNRIENLVQVPKMLHLQIHTDKKYPSKTEINEKILPKFLDDWDKGNLVKIIKLRARTRNTKWKKDYKFDNTTGRLQKIQPNKKNKNRSVR